MNPIEIISKPFEIRKLIMHIVNAEIIGFHPEKLIYIFSNRGHVIAQRTEEELEFLYYWLNVTGEVKTKEQNQLLNVMEKNMTLKGMKMWDFT